MKYTLLALIDDLKHLAKVYKTLGDNSEYYKGRYLAFMDIISKLEECVGSLL